MPNCYFTPLIVCNYLSCWIILQELAATFCILIQCEWPVYWDAKINWGTKISYVNRNLAYMSLIDNKYFHPTLHNGCNKLSILGLPHRGRLMHICVTDLTTIVSDNALSHERPFCLGLDVLNLIHVSIPTVCVTVWLHTSCRKLCSRQAPAIREKYIRSKWEIFAFQG